jgi:hypothetical protein
MSGFSLLADENVERQALRYLERQGHDAELVVDVDVLGPGSDDEAIRDYASEHGRLVLTSDDDFFAFDDPFLFLPDDKMDAYDLAVVVAEISNYIEQESLDSPVFVTREWLD